MSDLPSVTVLIPVRNEERDIERCLAAVLAQDHPHDRMEVVIVDGGSTDATRDAAAKALSSGDIRWSILNNSVGATPVSLNIGLVTASGEIVVRVDARSLIPPAYVRTCAQLLQDRDEIVVVGGAQLAVRRGTSARERGIARALNNRYSMGGSRYRSGGASGPADTVYLGAFRKVDLDACGGWDERWSTNQDFELNRRMSALGLVWFEDSIPVDYLPRNSVIALARQYHRFGRWKVRYWRCTDDPPQQRQVLALLVGSICLAALPATLVVTLRRPQIGLAASGAGMLGALCLDHGGSTETADGLRARLWSVAAIAAVTGGWTSGVWREALTKVRAT